MTDATVTDPITASHGPASTAMHNGDAPQGSPSRRSPRSRPIPAAARRGGMGFGDHVGPVLILLCLTWLAFASIDFWLTGRIAYTLYLGVAGAPMVLAAGFALAYPLLLACGWLTGWPPARDNPAGAGPGRPVTAFWLMVTGLPSLYALADLLPGLARSDLTIKTFCRFESAVPGQSAGLVLSTGEAMRDHCRLDPVMTSIAILPWPLMAAMLAALALSLLRLVAHLGHAGDLPFGRIAAPLRHLPPALMHGAAVPLLALFYIAAALLLFTFGAPRPAFDHLTYGAPLLALATLAAVLAARSLVRLLGK